MKKKFRRIGLNLTAVIADSRCNRRGKSILIFSSYPHVSKSLNQHQVDVSISIQNCRWHSRSESELAGHRDSKAGRVNRLLHIF